MKKRALMILMICILGSAAMPGPAFYALAATTDGGAGETGREKDGGILDKGTDLGGELYQKMDEALDRLDKESLRRNIREALREMDEMGVSPSVVAEKTLGLKTSPALRGQTPGDTLILLGDVKQGLAIPPKNGLFEAYFKQIFGGEAK